jgi:diaminopimelate decarboxylase
LGNFFKAMAECKHISWQGIHVYAGTQCLDAGALIDSFQNTLEIAIRIRKFYKLQAKVINFGGGFGLPYYEKQIALDLAAIRDDYGNAWRQYRKESYGEIRGIIELGRFLVGGAGVYITKVVDVKKSRGRWYGTLDGGMNHHLPASGNFGQVIRRNYQVMNLIKRKSNRKKEMMLVGPICSTIDVMSDKVMMPAPKAGDFVAYLYSGAYGLTASPILFLSHDLPKELVIARGGR